MDNPTRWPLTTRLVADYPEPSRLLYRAYPKDVKHARALGVEWEDIDSLCWLGAMHAEERFDAGMGIKFSTYAAHCMRSKLASHTRAMKAVKRACKVSSLDVPVYDDGPTYADSTPGPDVWAEYDRSQEIDNLIALAHDTLPASVRKAVFGLFGIDGNRTNREKLCETLGVPAWALQRMREMGMAALRKRAGAG